VSRSPFAVAELHVVNIVKAVVHEN